MLPSKKVLFAIVVAAGAFVLFGGAGKSSVSGDEAHQLVKQGAFLLDVRTEGEFASGHVDGAINIPVQVLGSRLASLPAKKDASIVVYCQSGRRSAMARELLEQAGYTKVFDLGAMGNWR